MHNCAKVRHSRWLLLKLTSNRVGTRDALRVQTNEFLPAKYSVRETEQKRARVNLYNCARVSLNGVSCFKVRRVIKNFARTNARDLTYSFKQSESRARLSRTYTLNHFTGSVSFRVKIYYSSCVTTDDSNHKSIGYE